MSTLDRLAKLTVTTQFSDFPLETVSYAKMLILSCFGAMLSGSTLPGSKVMARYVKQLATKPEATVIGCGFRAEVSHASLVNNFLAHVSELEDVSFPEGGLTINVIPPVFAVAQKKGLPGQSILEGFIIGYEIHSRLALACPGAGTRGFTMASITGIMGAAAATAKMLELDVQQTKMALAIATSQGSGLLAQTGTMAHRIDSATACRDGVMTAMLANQGFDGQADIIESPQGLFAALCGETGYDIEIAVKDLGKPFRVNSVGIRKYPCSHRQQPIIDGVLELKSDYELGWENVKQIEVEVSPAFTRSVHYPDPQNASEAGCSIEHSIVAAFLEEKLLLSSYTQGKALDVKYREARQKIHVIVHPDWGSFDNRINVELCDGQKLVKENCTAKGDPPNYLTEDEVLFKYQTFAGLILSDEQIKYSSELILNLERLKDIEALMEMMEGSQLN
ncbi:MmgE/PrpD family protein [Chloroflexota bacterium]